MSSYPRTESDNPEDFSEEEEEEIESSEFDFDYLVRDVNSSAELLEEELEQEDRERARDHKILIGVAEKFEDLLRRFRLYVEREGFEAFWKKSRKRGQKRAAPEEIAKELFFSFISGNPVGFYVDSEVKAGGGFVDLLVRKDGEECPVELKIWHGKERFEDGLEQIFYYTETRGCSIGYYIVFDDRQGVGKQEDVPPLATRKNVTIKITHVDINPPAPSKSRT